MPQGGLYYRSEVRTEERAKAGGEFEEPDSKNRRETELGSSAKFQMGRGRV